MILKRLLCLLYHFSVGAKLARRTEIGTWHASWHATCHANLARNRARARNTSSDGFGRVESSTRRKRPSLVVDDPYL